MSTALAEESAEFLPATEGGPEEERPRGQRRRATLRALVRYGTTPLIIIVVSGVLTWWATSLQLDAFELRTMTVPYMMTHIEEHVELTVLSTVGVIVVAVTLGMVVTRRRTGFLSPIAIGAGNIGQATPPIGLIVLLALVLGVGFWVAVLALFIYAALPVLRNTVTGIENVDPGVIEAAQGMGMGNLAILFRVQLPLALPVIAAGVRTALVLDVGTATIATFISAGGLGDMIVSGISLERTPVIVTGAVTTALLALAFDWVGGLLESALKPIT
ncbi:MAG TPA: ABC transporter permease [Acidimicrobiales bacterium]|nr:ABC transporter permease [Acidimicrobiales bacterium]